MRPAGDWRKDHVFFRGTQQRSDLVPLIAGRILPGAVEPVPAEGRAVDQRRRAAYSGPLLDPLDKVFLDRLREHVLEALDLGGLFAGDHGHLVAALEDGAAPAGETVGLPGQLGLEIAHEGCELLGAFGDGETSPVDCSASVTVPSVVELRQRRSGRPTPSPRTPEFGLG